jgi:hypothetical protein
LALSESGAGDPLPIRSRNDPPGGMAVMSGREKTVPFRSMSLPFPSGRPTAQAGRLCYLELVPKVRNRALVGNFVERISGFAGFSTKFSTKFLRYAILRQSVPAHAKHTLREKAVGEFANGIQVSGSETIGGSFLKLFAFMVVYCYRPKARELNLID